MIKVTDLGLAFRMTSPSQTARRAAVRGTLGKLSLLFEFLFDIRFRLHGTGGIRASDRI